MTLVRLFWEPACYYLDLYRLHDRTSWLEADPDLSGDMAAIGWPGQFNLDFFGFLLLSGMWTAWRGHFRPVSLLLALIAVFGGMLFLSIHLLMLSYRCRGDVRLIVLGPRRVETGP